MSLKKEKKQKANIGEPPKPQLISKTRNPWNPRLGLNQETQLLTNLMLNDEKNQFKKFIKLKKKIKRIRVKFDRKKNLKGMKL
jgi:hypothetical protein